MPKLSVLQTGKIIGSLCVVISLTSMSAPWSAAAADMVPCATVKAGDVVVPGYDCLNQQLSAQSKAAAQRAQTNDTAQTNASGAIAAPDKVGEQTPAGAELRFGKNFGVSPEPYRPPPPPPAGTLHLPIH